MKLKVDKGELNLPEDFSFDIQQNSAFFSEEGAASVAATIPATPSDLAKLNQPTRIARRNRFANLFPAIISHGAFQKKGMLVVTSASRKGITCAVALEDSEFYSQFGDKNLKEIFSAKILADYSTPSAWYDYLFRVYQGTVTASPFRLIPVAVNRDEESGTYQVNNEPYSPGSWTDDTIFPLRHDARIVQEGDEKVNVPEGYGIAPFYFLHAFLEDLFTLCGYSVGSNCFRTSADLNTLLLLHNCSDVICNGRIDCSDLVPNKTVSELLDWLLKKFRAQIVVHTATATVDLILLRDILTGDHDLDLTGKQLGDVTYSFSQASRVVIVPDTSLEGASPAADTMEDLARKYETLTELQESNGYSGTGLVLDRATGRYYEVGVSFAASSSNGSARSGRSGNLPYAYLYKDVGTNYFNYDRKDTDAAEEVNWIDPTPPMVFSGGVLMPYIGERKHRNTSYKDSAKDEDQEIVIVDYAGRSAADSGTPERTTAGRSGSRARISREAAMGGHYMYGTTQKYDNLGAMRAGRYNLNPVEMFGRFFAGYNRMLRNNMTKVEGRFDVPADRILSYRMYSPKLLDGQRLLPVSLRYEVGRGIRVLSASFYLMKDYADGAEDTTTVLSAPRFKWVFNESEIKAAVARVAAANPGKEITSRYSDAYSEGEDEFFLLPPTRLGQKSPVVERTVSIGYLAVTDARNNTTEFKEIETATVNVWFDSAAL